jgi:hypothetical protein
MGLVFNFIGSLIGLIFSLVGTLLGLLFGLLGGLLAAPVIIVLVLIGLLIWHPLLWVGLGLGGYLLYRLAHRRGYIEIRRTGPPRNP